MTITDALIFGATLLAAMIVSFLWRSRRPGARALAAFIAAFSCVQLADLLPAVVAAPPERLLRALSGLAVFMGPAFYAYVWAKLERGALTPSRWGLLLAVPLLLECRFVLADPTRPLSVGFVQTPPGLTGVMIALLGVYLLAALRQFDAPHALALARAPRRATYVVGALWLVWAASMIFDSIVLLRLTDLAYVAGAWLLCYALIRIQSFREDAALQEMQRRLDGPPGADADDTADADDAADAVDAQTVAEPPNVAGPNVAGPNVAGPTPLASAAADTAQVQRPRYARGNRSPQVLDAVAEQLRRGMLCEHWFRQEDLSLDWLSARLDVSRHLLSQVLSQRIGMSFSEYVVRLRLDDVCRQLAAGRNERSILDIALAAGFASKAGFNAAFRRYLGTSPREWRRVSTADRTAAAYVPADPRQGA